MPAELQNVNCANPLVLELLNWISSRPRTYAEAMDAWRSTCPRHSTWDDASLAGLIEVVSNGQGRGQSRVSVTARGQALLDQF
jgi:hypothetical protein